MPPTPPTPRSSPTPLLSLEASGSFSPTARMEQLDAQIYKKYTALLKQKQLDDDQSRKRDEDVKKFRDVMMHWVEDLKGKNEELRQRMSDMLDEQKKMREDLLHEIREKDEEILRLNLLLAEKNHISNSTASESVNRTPERTPQSNRKAKRSRLSKEATVSCCNSPEEEARELEDSRNHACARGNETGNETDEVTNVNMLLVLLESVFFMKISLNKTTEGLSLSAYHENTGYSFTLTWLEQRNEWSYMVSSLGSLESVARVWMKEHILFSMDMCPSFFQRISNILKTAY